LRAVAEAHHTSKPLEDYGLIGNMVSAALIDRDGSIDWLCLPHFDSPACFAALLGTPEHGRWKIAAADPVRRSRRYRPDTAILETHFETATGAAVLIDFMPMTDNPDKVDLVRIVRGVRGEVAFDMELVIRFNYGDAIPWVRRRDFGLSAVAGPDALELHTRLPLDNHNMCTRSHFVVREGEDVPFTLSYHPTHTQPHFVKDRAESLKRTEFYWRTWAERCLFENGAAWRDAVMRSLITLKLLSYHTTGAIVAAPTTSLPEMPGGSRNWDYRYCWLRDSALTLYALLNAGYRDEASMWREWLLRTIAGHPEQLQIVYGITGSRWLPENELPWLPGYAGSKPVRVGNAASGQLQLDVYGELMDTLHAAREAHLPPITDAWELQLVLLTHLEKIWRTPDRGIWEMRSIGKAFTHSRAMCWTAFDRAISSAERFKLEGPIDRWRAVRDAIADDILRHGTDARTGAFVQQYGGEDPDASLLLLAQMGLVQADDPRFAATVAAIESELMRDGFVKRYRPARVDDGIGEQESAFLPCSFWLADAYIMLGRKREAEEMFERLLAIRNDLGLLAEEYDPQKRRLMGNFPQAFSHVGLINTAFNLVKRSGPAQQRIDKTAPRAKHNAPPHQNP
jgi:GH15 family glucan-1,4-alpha-glucosidase